jgi:hypothetical protein
MVNYHLHRQVAVSIKNALAGILAGAGTPPYNFTPDGVILVRDWKQEYFNNITKPLVYMIRPGQVVGTSEPSFHCEEEAEFFILGVKRYEYAVTDPFDPLYVSETDLQDAMAFDVEKALKADVTRGGVSCKTFVPSKTFDLELPAAVVVEWRVLTEYEFLSGDPSNA